MRYTPLLMLAAVANLPARILSRVISPERATLGYRHRIAGEDDVGIDKRAGRCGSSVGSCAGGECCSEAGYCGVGETYCKGPQCQIEYSGGKCDADRRPCGEGTLNVSRSLIGNIPYDITITACKTLGTVALTFDDGPYIYTDAILTTLQQYNARATFFITGNNNGKRPIDDPSTPWPNLLRRMHSAGHHLASHSWTHQDLTKSSPKLQEQQLIYNEMAFRNIFGFFPRYFRAPYGACTWDSGCWGLVQRLGYHHVKWSVDTKDFENNAPEKIQVAKDTFDGGVRGAGGVQVVLAHDTMYQTAYNLTAFMLENLKGKGLRAVTVGECLGDPAQNWYISSPGGRGGC